MDELTVRCTCQCAAGMGALGSMYMHLSARYYTDHRSLAHHVINIQWGIPDYHNINATYYEASINNSVSCLSQ